MDTPVFLIVLFAALLHAGWNSLVKVGLDRTSTVLLLSLVQGVIALVALPFAPALDWSAWPWLVASAVLHTGYKTFLIRAYSHADLSQAYPLARGSAPLIVTVISVTFLGARFTALSAVAICCISAGILLMALSGGSAVRLRGKGLFYALGTASFTASYTLVDGIGAQAAGTATGFVLWTVLADTLLFSAFAGLARGRSAFTSVLPAWRTGAAAGALSMSAYWIIVWAFTQAPIALVATLRESSILFAALIALVVLKEPLSRARWLSISLIACGVVLMRL